MLASLGKITGFTALLELLTPGLVRVIPAHTLTQQARELWKNYRNQAGFRRALEARVVSADSAGVPVEVIGHKPTQAKVDWQNLSSAERDRIGAQVLHLYFHQFFVGDETFLDLGTRRFSFEVSLRWRPTRMWLNWDRDFRTAIIKIYSGMCTDDAILLREGLQALDLDTAESLSRQCFAPPRAPRAWFELEAFHRSFQAFLEHCHAVGVRLHRNFVPFSFYLASLVETLDALHCTCDLKAAFLKAQESNARHPAAC